MPDFGDAFEILTDPDTYTDQVAMGAVGYAAPHVLDNLAGRVAGGMDVPDEAAGLGTIALAEVTGAMGYKREVQAGAGVYTGEAVMRRVGVWDTVVNLGGA